MIDLRYKPYWLPQVSAPFSYTLDMLDDEKVKYSFIEIDPKNLTPSQGIVNLEKISKIDLYNIEPIWISKEDKILDGHHRYACALSNNKKIRAVKIHLNQKDAARLLNKIQDIFMYESQVKSVDEIVAQDYINAMQDDDFITMLENEMDDDKEILHDDDLKIVKKEAKKHKGYRKNKINEKSNVGNFFLTKPVEGYIEYDIEFDNLLDTNDMGLIFHKDDNPVFNLARTWFPHIDFSKISKKHDVSPESLINRAVCHKAKKLGYDGIKYGDIMIQGLN